jgi:hypothetical protein
VGINDRPVKRFISLLTGGRKGSKTGFFNSKQGKKETREFGNFYGRSLKVTKTDAGLKLGAWRRF